MTKDDIVRHGGNNYVCMVGHVSDPKQTFATDLNRTLGNWLKIQKVTHGEVTGVLTQDIKLMIYLNTMV